jgi:hypothetical protein
MPHLSSTDILITEANDMSNALKNPQPEVPIAQVGDDTIEALTKLAEIFKNNFQMHLPRPLKTKSLPIYPTQS